MKLGKAPCVLSSEIKAVRITRHTCTVCESNVNVDVRQARVICPTCPPHKKQVSPAVFVVSHSIFARPHQEVANARVRSGSQHLKRAPPLMSTRTALQLSHVELGINLGLL